MKNFVLFSACASVLSLPAQAVAARLPNLPIWTLDVAQQRDGRDYATTLTFRRLTDGSFSVEARCSVNDSKTGKGTVHLSRGSTLVTLKPNGGLSDANLGELGWAIIDHPDEGHRVWIPDTRCASGPYRISSPPPVVPPARRMERQVGAGVSIGYDANRWKARRDGGTTSLEFIVKAPDPADQLIASATIVVVPKGAGTPATRLARLAKARGFEPAARDGKRVEQVEGGPWGRYWVRHAEVTLDDSFVALLPFGSKDVFVIAEEIYGEPEPALIAEIIKGLRGRL